MWAIVFVIVNTIINLLGVDSLKMANRAFLAIELIFLVIVVVIAVRALSGGSLPNVGWSTTPIWNPDVVTAPLIASALSIAVLSFLGFDGISTLAEESTGKRNPAGKAMIVSLFIVAFLFIAQTWLASLLAGGRGSFSDDEAGNAFFHLVEAASNTGWMNAFFVVNVLAVGFANAMAAQAATSRLLYSMSRDRQLPDFLSKISSRQVPINDTRGERDQRRAGSVLRRPDRADLVAGELRRAVRLLPAAHFGRLVLHRAQEVEELSASPGRAHTRLPDHRIRAVQRGSSRQDRRNRMAGGWRGGVHHQ
jgi:hypothetical protein